MWFRHDKSYEIFIIEFSLSIYIFFAVRHPVQCISPFDLVKLGFESSEYIRDHRQ